MTKTITLYDHSDDYSLLGVSNIQPENGLIQLTSVSKETMVTVDVKVEELIKALVELGFSESEEEKADRWEESVQMDKNTARDKVVAEVLDEMRGLLTEMWDEGHQRGKAEADAAWVARLGVVEVERDEARDGWTHSEARWSERLRASEARATATAAAWAAKVEALSDNWERTHLTGFCSNGCDGLARGNKKRFMAELRALIPTDTTALDEVRAQAKVEVLREAARYHTPGDRRIHKDALLLMADRIARGEAE